MNYKNENNGKAKRNSKPISPEKIEKIALYYLERFSSSSENLKTVLMRRVQKSVFEHELDEKIKDACFLEIENVIRKFQMNNFLNDTNYATAMVDSLHRRGKSKKAIVVKLKTKGISDEDISIAFEQLEQNEEGDLEFKAALQYAKKRGLGPFRKINKSEKLEKDMAALARQGFSYDIVKRVMDENSSDFFSEEL